jgi:hypothetical protein
VEFLFIVVIIGPRADRQEEALAILRKDDVAGGMAAGRNVGDQGLGRARRLQITVLVSVPDERSRTGDVNPLRIRTWRIEVDPERSGERSEHGTLLGLAIRCDAAEDPHTALCAGIGDKDIPVGSSTHLARRSEFFAHIDIWPAGQPQPLASTLNSLDGRVKANAVVIAAGTGGAVSVYATDATDLVLDIDGYFVPATNTSALAFYPLAPCRVADTRSSAPLSAGQTRTFAIGCNVPASAQAYSLNFTVLCRFRGHLGGGHLGSGTHAVSCRHNRQRHLLPAFANLSNRSHTSGAARIASAALNRREAFSLSTTAGFEASHSVSRLIDNGSQHGDSRRTRSFGRGSD